MSRPHPRWKGMGFRRDGAFSNSNADRAIRQQWHADWLITRKQRQALWEQGLPPLFTFIRPHAEPRA